jgi:hypothetical protein
MGMSEIVERVAQALANHRSCGRRFTCSGFREGCHCYGDAEVAIAAMREPTEAMVESCPDEDAGLIWRDMIDAALKPPHGAVEP